MDTISIWRGDAQRTGFYGNAQITRSLPKIVWTFKAQGQIVSAAVVSDDKVVFGSEDDLLINQRKASSRLYALNQNTGKLLWKLFRDGETFCSSPTFWRSLIFWTASQHLQNGNVFAVNVTSGGVVWKQPIQGLAFSPLIHDNLLFVEGSSGLHAFNPLNGRVVWEKRTEIENFSPFAADRGKIFCSTMYGAIISLDARDGSLIWKREIGRRGLSGLIIVGDNLYYLTSEHEGKLHALNHSTGRKLWEVDFPAGESSPASDGRYIYAGSYEGRLSCFDLVRRKIIWQHHSGSKIDGAPILTPRVVCFGNDAGFVTALDRSTGNRLWRFKIEGKVVRSITISGKTLYCGGTEGILYALS